MPTFKKISMQNPAGTDGADISYHITGVRVPLFEVDLGQAVYHGNYFHLFETAREDFLRQIGFPYREFMNRQLHLAVVESSCSYRKPLRYDDQVEIHTGPAWVRRRSVSFRQSIFRENGRGQMELCTQACLNMVCVRFSGKAAALPDDFITLVKDLIGKSPAGE
jgi:acyl-CoA thioester hydrolase